MANKKRVIIVGYKVEAVISIDDGFKEREIDDIRKVVSEEVAKVEVEEKTKKYLKENIIFLKLGLSFISGWSEERVDKIKVDKIKVKQI